MANPMGIRPKATVARPNNASPLNIEAARYDGIRVSHYQINAASSAWSSCSL